MRKHKNLSVAIFGGLSDGKFNSKVEPLIDLNEIKQVHLFRFNGNPLDKKYRKKIHFYKNLSLSKYIYYLYASLLLFFFAARNRESTLIAFYFFPFGLITSIIGIMTNRPYILILPGSDLKRIVNKKKYIYFLNRSISVGVRGSNSKKELGNLGVSQDKLFVLHNAFKLPLRDIQQEKQWDVIFIGYFRKDKRLDVAIDVIQLLKYEFPDISAVFVGDGEEFDNIQALVRDLHLERNVYLTGHKEDVANYLKKSKVFLMTSQSEGLPMVLVESMSLGLPVVTSDINDISDIVKHDENGYLVKSLEANEYFGYLLKILKNKEVYDRLSLNSKLSMENFYSRNSSFEEVQKVWSRILNKY